MSDEPGARRAAAAAPPPPLGARAVGDPAAVADILASIRRIVTDERPRSDPPAVGPPPRGDVLVLTPDMRIDGAAARPGDAAIAEIVRAVLREEVEGEVGDRIVERVRAILRREGPGAPDGRG